MSNLNNNPNQRIDLSKPRYDQSTYLGRVRHFLDVIDPVTLLTTQSQLNNALSLIDKYNNNDSSVSNVPVDELYAAKKLKDSMVHPDTGDVIPAIGRMSAFVPANLLLTYGMLNSSTPLTQVFWQFMNQTYNVAMNFSNAAKQKGQKTDYSTLLKPYAGAVGVSCSLAVGLGEVAKRVSKSNASALIKSTMSILVPYTAVASAGAANVIFMRYNETQTGIEVKDQHNNLVGISRAAGYEALRQTAVTRVVLPVPILIVPPIIMKGIDSTSWMKNNIKYRTPVYLTVITGCLWAALPLAIALFPQTASIDVDKLEPEFKNKKDKNGNTYKTLYFNKGL